MKAKAETLKSESGPKASSVLARAKAPGKANRSVKRAPEGARIHRRASATFQEQAILAAHLGLMHTSSKAEFRFLKRELGRLHSSDARTQGNSNSPLIATAPLIEWARIEFRKNAARLGLRGGGFDFPRRKGSAPVRGNHCPASNQAATAAQCASLAQGKAFRIPPTSCAQGNKGAQS